MAHRQEFEERSGCDPSIVGKRIYTVGSEQYIGVAVNNWRGHDGRCNITVDIGDPEGRPLFITASRVLVELPRSRPTLDIGAPEPEPEPEPPPGPGDAPPLPPRTHTGYPVFSSPERERIFNAASLLGAEDQVRDEGSEGENVLPPLSEPDPPPNQLRPSGPVLDDKERPTDTYIHPRGKSFPRKKEDGAPTGGASTPTGGSTMASVAEVKAAIDAAVAKSEEAMAAARAAIEQLAEAQVLMAAAVEGSGHDSTQQAGNAYQHAKQQFEEGIQAVVGGNEAAVQYGAGL